MPASRNEGSRRRYSRFGKQSSRARMPAPATARTFPCLAPGLKWVVRDRKVSVSPAARYRLGALVAVLALPAQAHHGVAPHYDDGKQVTIDGTVAEFRFINPHSFV